jgi:Domain of unknown function (DUF4382)
LVLVCTLKILPSNGEVKDSQMSSKNILLSGVIASIIAIALVVAAIVIPGAGLFKASTTSSSSTNSGTLGIQLTDPPIVPPGVTAVYISYSEMEVHVGDAGNETGWYQIAPAGEIDLMSILNTSITLGSASVTQGVYNAIGFNITSATVTVNGANQTAFITNDKMFIPLVGGLQVQAGASEGVLVDMSPTVVAVMNGSETAYVLIPNAHALHIPYAAWRAASHVGDVVRNLNQQSWYKAGAQGDISLSNAALSNSSMSVTITNDGANSTVVSSLTVAYPLNVICSQYQSACKVAQSGKLPKAIPIAEFAVLSNGSLFQFNFTEAVVNHQSGNGQPGPQAQALESLQSSGVTIGYVLAPGQSMTFTFNGQVATITPNILNYINISVAVPQSLLNAISMINSGQHYVIAASGPFDTFATEALVAS